jgi:hypothetical protein
MLQSLEEDEKSIINPKIQQEEEKRTKEVVQIQLKENEGNCEKLESKIISLRKELENSTAQLNKSLKFEKSTEILDDIIKCQRSPLIKLVLVMIRVI